jgi:hypothetical protein
MKKFIVSVVSALLIVSLTGCSSITKLTEGIIGDGSVDYEELSYAIASPSGSSAGELEQKTITFSAYLGESFIMESDAEDINGKEFAYAFISRNTRDYFLVNIDGLDPKPELDSYVSITGKVDGYIYGTDEEGKTEALNILASKIEPLAEKEIEVDSSSVFEDRNGEAFKIDFKKAVLVDTTMGDIGEHMLVIYADYESIKRNLSLEPKGIFVYQGDSLLSREYSDIYIDTEQLDSSATEANTTLNEGEKAYVRYLYSGILDTTTPITVEAYDDDFDVIYQYTLELE